MLRALYTVQEMFKLTNLSSNPTEILPNNLLSKNSL